MYCTLGNWNSFSNVFTREKKLFPRLIYIICGSSAERSFTAIILLGVSVCSVAFCYSVKLLSKVLSDRLTIYNPFFKTTKKNLKKLIKDNKYDIIAILITIYNNIYNKQYIYTYIYENKDVSTYKRAVI